MTSVEEGRARTERKPRRMSPEQRRDDLIASALALFARGPHHQVTPEDIAAEADVSRALFYRYFSSMEELYLAALDVAMDGLTARLLPAGDQPPSTLVPHMVTEFFGFAAEYPTPFIAMLSRGHVVAGPEAYELIERFREKVIDEVLTRAGAQASPYLVLTLRSWIAVLEGTALTWVKRHKPDRAEVEAWAVDQLQAMLTVSARCDPATEHFRHAISPEPT